MHTSMLAEGHAQDDDSLDAALNSNYVYIILFNLIDSFSQLQLLHSSLIQFAYSQRESCHDASVQEAGYTALSDRSVYPSLLLSASQERC